MADAKDPKGPENTVTNVRNNVVHFFEVTIAVTPPNGKEITARLDLSPVVVGTDPQQCDIVVEDPSVSRRHCEIRRELRWLAIKDMSKNGTFIGEVRVLEAVLEIGAIVTIGSSRLVARATGTPCEILLYPSTRFGDAWGQSVRMRAVFAQVNALAHGLEPILFLGEPGTGKELLARAAHAVSPRRDGPFVVFDADRDGPDVEADLFGYVPGAFPGVVQTYAGAMEQANGGTLFLEGVDKLPPRAQMKLLRAIQEKRFRRLGAMEWQPFDARVMASTLADLRPLVAEEKFHGELCYRLHAGAVRVPPLRDRKEDIPLLLDQFLTEYEPRRTLADLPPNTLALLAAYAWPGNVRELRSTVRQIASLPQLDEEAIAALFAALDAKRDRIAQLLRLPLQEARERVVEDFERPYILAKLKESGGNVTDAAHSMGITRQRLYQLLDKYGIKSGK